MMLIDIGANLTHDSFAQDLDEVIERARANGVARMVVTGADLPHSMAAHALAQQYPGTLYATAGIHPHHATSYADPVLAALEALAAHPDVVALGECGLDFYRDFSPHDVQKKAFEAQLELAVSLKMPVFLHQRDAHASFLEILSRYRHKLPRAVAHCFTGNEEELAAYMDLDLHIGITGWICDERRGHHLCDLIARIPEDRLMIETDAPYLLPRDLIPKPRARRNEPMYLGHVCEAVARCMGAGREEVASATTRTASSFFSLANDLPGRFALESG
jgi:TatD DNase family protein